MGKEKKGGNMWIPEFWCGVIATILVEAVIVAFFVVRSMKDAEFDDNAN